jgi:hypothetical protein
MPDADPVVDRLAAFCLAHDVRVEKAGRACTLLSTRAGAPVAQLRATDEDDKVRVLWWTGKRWAAPGPFGTPTLPLQRALDYVASEAAFWIHA